MYWANDVGMLQEADIGVALMVLKGCRSKDTFYYSYLGCSFTCS